MGYIGYRIQMTSRGWTERWLSMVNEPGENDGALIFVLNFVSESALK